MDRVDGETAHEVMGERASFTGMEEVGMGWDIWRLGGWGCMVCRFGGTPDTGRLASMSEAIVVVGMSIAIGWAGSLYCFGEEKCSLPLTGGEWARDCGECAAEPPDLLGEGTSEMLTVPYFSSVRCRTIAASSGSSTFHFRASTLRVLSALRAHGQSSAISSRCLTPWIMSRLAVFSGRCRMCIVQAVCTMYTAMLQICLKS
jgi:hypothetical protein